MDLRVVVPKVNGAIQVYQEVLLNFWAINFAYLGPKAPATREAARRISATEPTSKSLVPEGERHLIPNPTPHELF